MVQQKEKQVFTHAKWKMIAFFVFIFSGLLAAPAFAAIPAPRCDAYNALEGLVNNIVGQIRGLSGFLTGFIVLLLGILAFVVIFSNLRRIVVGALLAVFGIAILITVAPGLLNVFITGNNC
jgi:hypothetical protein